MRRTTKLHILILDPEDLITGGIYNFYEKSKRKQSRKQKQKQKQKKKKKQNKKMPMNFGPVDNIRFFL